MKALSRIFKYVWPQWARIIVVLVSAIIVSSMLSLSFMTVIPLLKIMIGEGVHGWVERKICTSRYGITFSVPQTVEVRESDPAYNLSVTHIKKGSLAEKAGFHELDIVIGAGDFQVSPQNEKVPRGKLLEVFATAPLDAGLMVQILRGTSKITDLTLNTGQKPFYLDRLEKWMALLPREQTRENKTKAIVFIVSLMFVVTVIRCSAKFCQEYMAQKVVQVGINHLREDAFGHALDIPVGFFSNERPSDTVSRIVGDTAAMGKAIKIMLGKALREPLSAVFTVAAAMWLNWQLTLVFLCGAPMILWLLVVFGRKMKRATRRSLVARSQILGKLQETMAGLKIVKIYNRHNYERQSFKAINNRLMKQLLKMSKVDAATLPAMEILGMAAGAAALLFGARWVMQGDIDGEEFLGLLLLLGVAAEAARKTSDIWNKVQEANAAAERVFAVVDAPVEEEAPRVIELPPVRHKIEFRDVVFTYPRADEPALRGINLSVQAGQNVAIVGPNGSGKTTLANLIPRFYDPDSGQVLIDDMDIHDVSLRSLRDQIGMVTQNLITFNDTIAANIGYGKTNASDKEIVSAAKRAFAHEFIALLPHGYQTVIGEQGVGLSGGQLQRIIIARAILKNPSILIFDEATSQVDADSESKIHQAIEEIMHERTSFIIAHRFSTVICADIIVVMDKGEIIAEGRHSDLLRSCPLYQNLSETQLVKA